MNKQEILNLFLKEGILLDSEVLSLLSEESEDLESVKLLLNKLKRHTSSKIITKKVFHENKEQAHKVFTGLPEDKQKKLEKLKIRLGLEIEISKEVTSSKNVEKNNPQNVSTERISDVRVKVLSKSPAPKRDIGVKDFVDTLRDKFVKLKDVLQDRRELENLVSINKLSDKRKKISIIGMVSEKRITKNKNLLLEVEDLTGKIRVLVNNNKSELFELAEEMPLDAVVGFTGFGDREIFFVNNIVLPEARIQEKKHSPVDESAIFISDLHYGSKLFMQENFDKFIDYLNGKGNGNLDREEVNKIKYLFVGGDVVSGVGVYSGQKKELLLKDLESQFQGLSEMFGKIKSDIKIIISPGNHDGVRLMEPQPVLDEKYAWPLYNLKNVILTGNPAYTNIGSSEEKGFEGFDVLTYHGFSYPYYANNVPSLMKGGGMNAPEKIMEYLLKYRHLAPAFGSTQTLPMGEDQLTIDKLPDIFVSGHSHKCGIKNYNNILTISNAAWERETEFQKRKGNQPDFCKVPMVNLKTRAVKLLDFE